MIKPKIISFNLQKDGMQKITSTMDGDFILVNQGQNYLVRSFIASHFSRKIFFALLEDSLLSQMDVQTTGGNFIDVQNYLNGNLININTQNALFLFFVGCELQVQSLIDLTIPHLTQFIDQTKDFKVLIDSLNAVYQAHMAPDKLVSFAANSLSNFLNIIPSISDEILDDIFGSLVLSVDQKTIADIIKSRVDLVNDPNNRLLKHVAPEFFVEGEFSNVLDNPLLNMNTLRTLFLKERMFSQTPSIQQSRREFNYVIDPFDGIIKSGIIPEIKTKSELIPGYEPQNLFTTDDSYFCVKSKDGKGSVLLKFQVGIKLSGYTMRSWKYGANGVCPKTWVLDGSNNGKDWVTIDHKTNDLSLKGNNKAVFFNVKAQESYQFFRIRQLDSFNPGNRAFALSCVEFFGVLD